MENKSDRRGVGEETIISNDMIKELMEFGCNEYLIKHSVLVTKIAHKIVEYLKKKGYKVDEKAVLKGAILHDVGRTLEHSVRHGYLGGEILRKKGYEETICQIVEKHVGGGISREESIKLGLPEKDYLPSTLEEKIVCLADKYVEDNNISPLEITLNKLEQQLGKDNMANQRILMIKMEIENLMQRSMNEIINEII
ncbi:MAG: HD domain-containing protein [Nitrososphaeria archaeon]